MKKQPEATPIKTLRDAYKVRGFRVLAKLDSYNVELLCWSSRSIGAQKNGVRRLRENLPQPL